MGQPISAEHYILWNCTLSELKLIRTNKANLR